MRKKTIIEEFKDQEKNLNMVAEELGFSFKLTINSYKNANLTLYKRNEKITTFETLTIEVKSQIQFIIKKGDEIIIDGLFCQYLLMFMYNYLYYENVEFFYQFKGRPI